MRSGEVSLLCACVHPKPFHDRCTLRKTSLGEELRSAQSVVNVNNCPDTRLKWKHSVSTVKAQQLSSSGVRHWKAPGRWGGQPVPLTPPQPDRLGHEREWLNCQSRRWLQAAVGRENPSDFAASGDTSGGMVGWRYPLTAEISCCCAHRDGLFSRCASLAWRKLFASE